ncbi:hypothetical protein WISP_120854 [Willisornis vidua]|uniref:Uncharacterized protein n=1 Tax=Willisornis vidua TaxID=1566151 RepID=A0ABQ9CYQ0_9PASS|nr:hypothetical protein WISP_120854 [Willisornis vidua]
MSTRVRLPPGQEKQSKLGIKLRLEIGTKAQESFLPFHFSAGLHQQLTCRSLQGKHTNDEDKRDFLLGYERPFTEKLYSVFFVDPFQLKIFCDSGTGKTYRKVEEATTQTLRNPKEVKGGQPIFREVGQETREHIQMDHVLMWTVQCVIGGKRLRSAFLVQSYFSR